MKQFSIDELATYATCPLQYLYKYEIITPIKETLLQAKRNILRKLILEAAQQYIYGNTIYPQDLQDKFDLEMMQWAFDHDIHIDSMGSELSEGRLQTYALYNVLLSHSERLLAVCLPLTESVYLPSQKRLYAHLQGSVDMVSWTPSGQRKRLQLISLYTSRKKLTNFEVSNSVRTALHTYLLNKSYKKVLKKYDDLSKSTPEFLFIHVDSQEIIKVSPNKDTLDSVLSWLYNLVKALKTGIYYPSVGKNCIECPYKTRCKPSDARYSIRKNPNVNKPTAI